MKNFRLEMNAWVLQGNILLGGAIPECYPAWALGFSERGEVVSRTSPDISREAFSPSTLQIEEYKLHITRKSSCSPAFAKGHYHPKFSFAFQTSCHGLEGSDLLSDLLGDLRGDLERPEERDEGWLPSVTARRWP